MEITKRYLKLHWYEGKKALIIFGIIFAIQFIIFSGVNIAVARYETSGSTIELIRNSLWGELLNWILFILGIVYGTKTYRVIMGIIADRKHYRYSLMSIGGILLISVPILHWMLKQLILVQVTYFAGAVEIIESVSIMKLASITYFLFAGGLLAGVLSERLGPKKTLIISGLIGVLLIGGTIYNSYLIHIGTLEGLWPEMIHRWMLNNWVITIAVSITLFFTAIMQISKVDIRKVKGL